MSEPLETGPNITRLANHMRASVEGIQFIGNDGKPYERDYEADARWYIAYNIAMDMCETYRAKDWAHYVLEGMSKLGDEEVGEYCHYTGSEEDKEAWAGEPTKEEIIKWLHG